MHFDPAKEPLDLPSGLVQRTDAQGGERHVAADEQQALAGVGILVTDAANFWLFPQTVKNV
jgi:hypothetical protein